MIDYNLDKLSTRDGMRKLSVFNAGGGGAVGSRLVEQEVQAHIGHITVADRDSYEPDNHAKCSGIIRYPEDDGRPKAEACAERASAIAPVGSVINSIYADLTRLGPMAYSPYNYVINALDNATAKMIMNRNIKLCPTKLRPKLLSLGTNGEHSEANLYAAEGACLRCGFPDEWLDEPDRSWSCTGGADYLLSTIGPTGVRTSGRPSTKSAVDAVDLIEGDTLGFLSTQKSVRITQDPFPYKNLSVTDLPKRCDCPDCKLVPPEQWTELLGCSYSMTLREAFNLIAEALGHTAFYLKPYELILPDRNGDRCYNQFVASDRCRICGKKISVYRHTGRIHEEDVVCDDCHSAGLDNSPVYREFDDAEVYRAFRPGKCGNDVLELTLYQLGYPLGGFLEVEIDEEKLIDPEENSTAIFAFSEDPGFVYSNNLVLE